jgi:predicted nucleic-acid-binding Zn-ribbon protein
MRSTHTCPKCAYKKFATTTEFRQPVHRSTATEPFFAVTLNETQGMPFFGSSTKPLGGFETWICLGCGYTEFYAHGLTGVEELAKQHPEQLRIVDARSPGQGPYR